MPELKKGIYRHYKGKEYKVIGTAIHTESREKHAVYYAMYPCPELDQEPLFIRPLSMFLEQVEIDGKVVPRFEWVREEE